MKNEIQNLTENEYTELLNTAKAQINAARNAIAVHVNSTANSTYWNIGKLLHEKKIEGGYGGKVINRLSVDLKQSFPDMGLSPRNLWNMKLFYERYIDSDKKLLQAVAVLQWGHNLLLINKKLSDEETFYYATESVLKNWNRDLLLNVELALQDVNKPIAVSDYELLIPKKELQTLVLNEIKLAEIYNDNAEKNK
ncbi:MAG: DUF1016 N-terminal domain-containing protein [Treponema sp.]|nr:DUF1016 N-terminal domain-containing protein [Treponema sp.]MCI7566363.1 DUF1016 N-terminal domain-containing protein [Treponema sp.]